MSKDIFDKKISDIKTPDWRQVLTEVNIPKPPAASRSGSTGLQAFNQVMQMQRRQQQEAERAQREIEKQQAAQQKEFEKQLEANPGLGAPAWEDVKSQIGGYDDLPFKAKREKYDEYLAAATEIAKEFNPTANELDIKFSIQENNPFTDKEPTRTLGERLLDYDTAFGTGVWSGIGGIADFANSGIIPFTSPGGNPLLKAISDTSQDFIEKLDKRRSAVSADRQAQLAYEAQRFKEENPDAGPIRKIAAGFGRAIRNPSLETVVGTAGSLAVSGGAGGAAGTGARLLGVGAKGAKRFSLSTLAATNAAIEGGNLARDAYDTVMDTPWEELDVDLREEALADNDGDREKAHEALALAAMTTPAAVGAVISGISTFASPVDRALSRYASGARSTARAGLKRGAATAAGEGVVGGVEEGMLRAGGNIATRSYVPGLDWTEGVGEAIGEGAIGGVGVGTATGTAQMLSGRNAPVIEINTASDTGEGESVSDIPGFGEGADDTAQTAAASEVNPELDVAHILATYTGDINADLEASVNGDAEATGRLNDFGLTDVEIVQLNTQRILDGGKLAFPDAGETAVDTETPAAETVTETETPTAETVVDTETPTAETVTETETPAAETVAETETPTAETVTETETPTAETVTETETPTTETVTETETPTAERNYSRTEYEQEARASVMPKNMGDVSATYSGRRIDFRNSLDQAAYLMTDADNPHPRRDDLREFVIRSLGNVPESVADDFGRRVYNRVVRLNAQQRGTNPIAMTGDVAIPEAAWLTHKTPPGRLAPEETLPDAVINRQESFPVTDPDNTEAEGSFEWRLVKHIRNSKVSDSTKQNRLNALNSLIRSADLYQRLMDDPTASRLSREEAARKYRLLASNLPSLMRSRLGIAPSTADKLMRDSGNRASSALGEAFNRAGEARQISEKSGLRRYLSKNPNPTYQGLLDAVNQGGIDAVQAEATRKIIDVYRTLGVPLPRIETINKRPDSTFLGGYSPAFHKVVILKDSTLSTLNHELLHGLSSRVIRPVLTGDTPKARGLRDLLNSMHDQIAAATNVDGGFSRYGVSYLAANRGRGRVRALDEMFAEMINPEFTDALNNIRFIPPAEGTEARAEYDRIMGGKREGSMSLREAFAEMITRLIRSVLPVGTKHKIDSGSILEVLNAAAADLALDTANLDGPVDPKNVYDMSNKTKDVADQFHSDQADANLSGNGPIDNDISTGERDSAAQTIEDIRAGKQAKPATFRGALKHAYDAARKRPQDQNLVSAFFQALNNNGMSHMNMLFHTHREPFINWVNRLPDTVSEYTRQTVKGALETAGVKRDHHLGEIVKDSGRAMFQELAALGKKNKSLSEETVRLRVGQWLTAVRVPAANAKLLQRDIAEVKRITKEYSDAVKAEAAATDPVEAGVLARKTAALRTQLNEATRKMARRQQAINNPDLTTKVHAEGVAGGMSNAMAAEVRRSVEALFGGVDGLERVAKHVYDMNAYVLALDIETGRSNPTVVGEFLERPDLIPLFNQLVAASRNADARQPATVQLLKDLRKQVRDAVRSDYVPMSGNPKIGLDPDLFMSGTSVPNTGGLHMMDGRKTTIADDGITASWNRAINSATFAGYHEFTKQLHNVWLELGSTEARNAAGIYRQTLKDKNSFPRDAVIYRTQSASYALRFDDPLIMQSLKTMNMQDANIIMSIISKPTQWLAYMMTQGNPAFAPKNAFRDAIERSENMRFRNYVKPDGTEYTPAEKNAAARNMLRKYGSWQFYAASMRYAWTGKTPDTYYGRLLDEMLEQGGVSVFGDRFARDNSSFTRNIMREKSHVKKTVATVGRLVDAYNRGFDILSSISSYAALREMGMDPQTAGAEALDLMNFRKTGSAMPILRAAYVFAQPAVTGGANIVATMYDRRTGRVRRRALARFGAYTLMLMMVQGMIRGFSDEDEGGKLSDQLGDFIHAGNIPIPVGDGSYFLVTTPYGYLRLAAGIGRNSLQAFAGEKGVGQAVADFIGGTVIPSITPFEYTMIDLQKRPAEGFILGIMPTALEPLANIAMNRTSFDTPIVGASYQDREQFRHKQYGGKIAPIYSDMAKFLYDWTGVDLPPEQVRFLFQQYGQGIFRLAGNMFIEDPYKDSVGKLDTPALAKTFFARPHPNAITAKFHEYLETAYAAKRKYNAQMKLTDEEEKYLFWLNRWEKTDQALRTEKGKITRNKLWTEEAKERRTAVVDEKRSAAQRRALYEIRKTLGLTTEWTGY